MVLEIVESFLYDILVPVELESFNGIHLLVADESEESMVPLRLTYRFRNNRGFGVPLGSRGGSEIFLVLLFMIGNMFAAFQLIPQHNQLKIKVLLILGGLVDVEEIMDIDSSLIRDDIILVGTHLLIVPGSEHGREKLNKNSTNNSKPPSTDFYKKLNPKHSTLNSRDHKGTDKKTNGGQKGHPGKTMELRKEPDAVQRCTPKTCDGCPLFGKCKTTVVGSRSVIDVVIQTFQTQFDQVQCSCPMQGGAIIRGEYPAGVNSHFQYGDTLKSLVVTLSSFGMMSMSRIVETLNALTGLNMSDSTVNNMILSCSNKCKELLPELRKLLLDSHTIGFDETGISVCDKNHWMHTASTKDLTFMVSSPIRGRAGIDDCGVLPHFKGVAVHDSWAPYYNKRYAGATYALCYAHIDREL